MIRRIDRLPPDVEHDVAERLARAFHAGAGDTVDVTALAAGTRRGIVRAAARRRAAVVAAAVAAVAVPVGVVLLGPSGTTGSVGPAATSSPVATSSPAPSPTDTPTQTPTVTPSDVTTSPTEPATESPVASPSDPAPSDGTGAATDPYTPDPEATVVPLASLADDTDPRHVAYLVPDGVALRPKADFPLPVIPMYDGGDYRFQPTVPGQACGSRTSPNPVAAQQWSWSEENSNRFDQLGVSLVVSGWEPGTTAARFADIRQGDGVCHWSDAPSTVSTAGMPGDEAWAASFVHNGYASGRAAIRVGDVIVGVEVYHPDGRAASVSLAKELAGVVAERVTTSGLAATAAAGG
jgi:hypothetical protein